MAYCFCGVCSALFFFPIDRLDIFNDQFPYLHFVPSDQFGFHSSNNHSLCLETSTNGSFFPAMQLCLCFLTATVKFTDLLLFCFVFWVFNNSNNFLNCSYFSFIGLNLIVRVCVDSIVSISRCYSSVWLTTVCSCLALIYSCILHRIWVVTAICDRVPCYKAAKVIFGRMSIRIDRGVRKPGRS